MRQYPVRSITLSLSSLLLAVTLGCHAQAPGDRLPPEEARRVEIMLRTRTKMPPDYVVTLGTISASEIPGFDKVPVTFSNSEHPAGAPIFFYVSKDGKTLAQFTTFDVSGDPKTFVPTGGRPARGGPEGAPVDVVAFDDLECPFCAQLHAAIFPLILERYGDKVHIIYRDYPLTSIHPWAMRAAIDVNCVAAQSTRGYWNAVDYIHAHASDFGGKEHSLEKANQELDAVALDEAKKDGLKTAELEACLKKQDDTAIKASVKVGDALGIEATPIFYVNGEKFEGAYPVENLFRMIDGALIAAGQIPPPPYMPPPPPPAAKPPATATPTPATKP